MDSRFRYCTGFPRAARIRFIHEQLRNNPNGAEVVQNMPADEFAATPLYDGPHSSEREASSSTVAADGSIVRNPYLWGNQPD